MAENDIAVQDPSTESKPEPPFQYEIKIEDAGPATKKVSVEIPPERIATKLEEQFKELRSQAVLPGFRPGHAPRKLIEKKFHNDVREQVRRTLVSESFEQAVEKHALKVIGEPKFDNPEDVKLPETGSFTYSFQVEVQPEFVLPNLDGLKVRKPKVELTDAHVEEAMKNLRSEEGALVPVEDRGVEADDFVVADVHLVVEGNEAVHRHDLQFRIAPNTTFMGIKIDDADKQLVGMKPGEKREFTVKVPDTYAEENLRGKDGKIEITLKDIKKLELAEVNADFLEKLGFTNEADLRAELKVQMAQRIETDIKQSMRDQVAAYLLQNSLIDLPTNLSKSQTDRVIARRAVSLQTRGVPQEVIDRNLSKLAGGAQEEAVRELKLFFVLQKLATQLNVEVSEGELNNEIFTLSLRSGRRPEKLKQDMSADGSLTSLYVQLREQKALDKVLETSQIEEVEVQKLAEVNPPAAQ